MARAIFGHCGEFSWQDCADRVVGMERHSHNSLARIPTAAIVLELVLTLGCLPTLTISAPYTIVANVVSHFVVNEEANALLPQIKANVQCSALPGLQCKALIQDNRLIINVFQDVYEGGNSENFKVSHEEDTVVSTFRWSSSKPDRISVNSNNYAEHIHEAEMTSMRNIAFEPDDTQEESLEPTSHAANGSDDTDDDFQEDIYNWSSIDDTTSERNRNTENSADKLTTQASEFENGEDQSDDHGYNTELPNHLYNSNEFLNEDNTIDKSYNPWENSESREASERKYSLHSVELEGNNASEHDFEEKSEEREYYEEETPTLE